MGDRLIAPSAALGELQQIHLLSPRIAQRQVIRGERKGVGGGISCQIINYAFRISFQVCGDEISISRIAPSSPLVYSFSVRECARIGQPPAGRGLAEPTGDRFPLGGKHRG